MSPPVEMCTLPISISRNFPQFLSVFLKTSNANTFPQLGVFIFELGFGQKKSAKKCLCLGGGGMDPSLASYGDTPCPRLQLRHLQRQLEHQALQGGALRRHTGVPRPRRSAAPSSLLAFAHFQDLSIPAGPGEEAAWPPPDTASWLPRRTTRLALM